jgi:CDP-diacylglycerol--inositol 3-phosphatidyltransferase
MVYPKLHVLCILLIFLDIFSHWFQMYASLAVGATTHKVRQPPP